MEKASIVTMTYNRSGVLEKTLDAMLELDYPEDYEIIVVNDGSTDGTAEMLKKFEDKIRVIHQERGGPCAARNAGLKVAKYPIVINMDDDCIPEKDWLKDLVTGFDSPKVGIVSAFDIYGGTSTAFRKEALDKVGYYDEEYFYYREDTDLAFRILDAGYEARKVDAEFDHVHKFPSGFVAGLKYAKERLTYHPNDVLLYKKNPKRAKDFLDVRFGFLIDPVKDFKVVTRNWAKKRKINISSPRGTVFIENKTPLHGLAIFIVAICYVVAVKTSRLYGSIKYKKLLL